MSIPTDTHQISASVMLVDGSASSMRSAKTILSQAGLQVIGLIQAKNVVLSAKRHLPKVIVLDFDIPDLPAYELCRQLGAEPDLARIPIILAIPSNDFAGERFNPELGIVDTIKKPYTPSALSAVVLRCIERTQSEGYNPRRESTEAVLLTKRIETPATRRIAQHIWTELEGRTLESPAQAIQNVLENSELEETLVRLVFEREMHPAFMADLSNIGIADILQMLSMQRQTGRLRVQHASANVNIYVSDGDVRLVTGENVGDEFLLGHMIRRLKMVSSADLDMLLENRKGTQRLLGKQLVTLNYLSQEQLHIALRLQSAELVYEMLRWNAGYCSFDKVGELPQHVLEFEFGLRVDELLMEGFRRVDEWGLIESVLPSFDAVLYPIDGDLQSHVGSGGLTAEEKEVFAKVDGRQTANQIIQTTGKGTFETAKILYRLLSAKVVRTYL